MVPLKFNSIQFNSIYIMYSSSYVEHACLILLTELSAIKKIFVPIAVKYPQVPLYIKLMHNTLNFVVDLVVRTYICMYVRT